MKHKFVVVSLYFILDTLLFLLRNGQPPGTVLNGALYIAAYFLAIGMVLARVCAFAYDCCGLCICLMRLSMSKCQSEGSNERLVRRQW
jgi:hypothetical protein